MTNDSQTPSEQLRSALVEVVTHSISRAELRALRDGIGDLYHFLRPHKKRIVTYAVLVTSVVGLFAVGVYYSYWALISMVDRSSIVLVEVEHAPPDPTRPWQRVDTLLGRGTGSIIQGRRILTAAHVVADAAKIKVTRADQDEAFEATLVATSHEVDLAILTVRDDRFFYGATPLELQSLDHKYDELVAYGFPADELEYAIGWFKDAQRDAYVQSDLENLKYCVEAPIERGYLRRGSDRTGIQWRTRGVAWKNCRCNNRARYSGLLRKCGTVVWTAHLSFLDPGNRCRTHSSVIATA
jgi:S1-C subfamily serine protease